jgi:IS1 family transposase
VANFISREKQIQVLRLLSEGNSIRSTMRLTGIHKSTIMRLVVRFGNDCRTFLDDSLANLNLRHIQCDEIWTFVGMKQGRANKRKLDDRVIGDQYLFTALDTDTKLLVTFAVGKRTSEMTRAFIADLEKRLVRQPVMLGGDRPQISTDGWNAYVPAIRDSFRGTVKHGVLIKNYVNPEVGRYAPPQLIDVNRFNINGINDLGTICTSHVERNNLTIRTFMRRFTRLALGFSKKVENLAAATAIHVAVYNFCRIHSTLRATPAMAAGVIDRLWSMDDLFSAVEKHSAGKEFRRKRDARIARLIRKLREN